MNVLVVRSCVLCSSSVSLLYCWLIIHRTGSSRASVVWCLCVVIPSGTPHPVKMLSSAMTRSLDFLVALFTDFTPIFGGPPGADGSVSPTDRRASRTQENWLLSRLQATFSPSASPNRRRCNSDASACHILCLPPPSKVHKLPQGLIAHGAPSPSFIVLARRLASRPRVQGARVRTEGRAPQPQTPWTRT